MSADPCAALENELFDAIDNWNKVAFNLGLPKPRRDNTKNTASLNIEYETARLRYIEAEAKLAECKKAQGEK